MKRKMVMSFNDQRSRWTITAAARALIREALPADWELVEVGARVSSAGDGSGVSAEAIEAIGDAEIYAGMGFPRELFSAATALRWVHTGAAGVGSLLYPGMVQSDVVLTNSAGIHAPAMAETVMAAVLYFARGFDFANESKLRHAWDQSQFETDASPVIEVADSVLGLIGYGGIGREVAHRAKALGMRVIATRRRGPEADPHAEILASDGAGLERVLRESDFLVITTPSTPETRGMIGADELGRMKSGAVLINVARGSIVVESDLIAVLHDGRLRGAALDVFEKEPLPAESALWNLPNTLLLPHISATTPRFWHRQAELIADNIKRYVDGRPLRNVVDKAAGY